MKLPSASSSEQKTDSTHWTVGTLTYTTSGLILVFIWLLLGDFAWNLKERAIIPIAQLMLKEFKATDFLIGLLVGSFPAAIGMIIGPIIAVKSDNHRGRWGRRIPYLLIPTPFIGFFMAGLALSPRFSEMLHLHLAETSPGLHFLQIVVFSFFWTGFEISTYISNTVFGGLVNDVVPQRIIGRFYGFFRIVSLFAGVLFNFFLMGNVESHMELVTLGIGLTYCVGIAVMCWKVKEGNYPPPVFVKQESRWKGMKSYFQLCFTNRYYLWIFSAMTFGMISFGPINSFSVFYAKSLNMSMDRYGKYLALTYAISMVVSYFVGSLADRYHPIRVAFFSLIIYGLATFIGAFLINSESSFGFFFVIHGVASGVYLTGTSSIGQRLFPKDQFSQFFSAYGILMGVCLACIPPITGLILDWSHHRYELTFLLSGIITFVAIFCYVVVYLKYQKLGGDQNYQAP